VLVEKNPPCRTWLPVLKYLRSCSRPMSSRSCSSRWLGFTVTVPSAFTRSTTLYRRNLTLKAKFETDSSIF